MYSKKRNGFTLVELVLYVGILSLVLIALANLAYTIQSSKFRFMALSELHNGSSRVLSVVDLLVRNADGFVEDASGNDCFHTDKLWLYFATSSLRFLPPACAGDYASTAVAVEVAGTTGRETIPSSNADSIYYGTDSDGTYVYSAGKDATGWRIDKRRISDLKYDTGFGQYGIVNAVTSGADSYAMDIIEQDGWLYIVGRDQSTDWRIEKRSAETGILDPTFGAIIDTTPVVAWGVAYANGYVFTVGSTGAFDWHITKRSASDGQLDTSFGTNGRITVSGNAWTATGVAVDSEYIYISGFNYYCPGFPDPCDIHSVLEKRYQSNGDYVASFGSGGWVIDVTADYAYDVTVANGYVYVAGFDGGNAGVIAKRDVDDGSESWTATAGASSNDFVGIEVDDSYVYVIGTDDNTYWSMEKRQISDGLLCDGGGGRCGSVTFGTSGVVTGSINGHGWGIVKDGDVLLVGGDLTITTNVAGVERRLATTGALSTVRRGVRMTCYQEYPGLGKNAACSDDPLYAKRVEMDLIDNARLFVGTSDLTFATTTVGSQQAIETTLSLGYDSRSVPPNFTTATVTASSTAAFRKDP